MTHDRPIAILRPSDLPPADAPIPMDQELKTKADERFEKALERSGARDPRDYYREQLRELKDRDPDAYRRCVRYYEEDLLPGVAEGDADPLAAWEELGLLIAEETAEGRTVEIDRTGRAHDHDIPSDQDRLVLHLPHDPKEKALLVALPPEPSAAQRATYDLLVRGKQTLDR